MAKQNKVLVKVGELMQHTNEILLMKKCKESSQPTTYDDSLMSQSVSARSEDASSNCSANIEDIEGEKCTAPLLTEEACVPEVQGHKPDSPCVAEEPKLSEFMAKQSKDLVKVGELMQHTNEILLMEKCKKSSKPTTYDDSPMSQSVSARSEDRSSNCSANIENIEEVNCTAPPLTEEACVPEVQGHKPDSPCVAEEPKLSEFMAKQSKVLVKVGELMQHTNEILLMEKCKESSQPTTYDDSHMSQSVSARSENASSNCSANIEDIEEKNCTAPPLTEKACVPEVQGHKSDPPRVAEEPKLSEFMAEQSKVLVKVGELMQHTNDILLMEKCKESSQPTTYDDSLMSQSVSARSEDASSNCSANIEDIEEVNCTAPPLTEEACVPEVQGHKPDSPCVAEEPKLSEFMAKQSKVLVKVGELMQHTNEILLMEKCKEFSQPTTYDDSLVSQSVSARSEDASSNCSANIEDIVGEKCTAPPLIEEARFPEVQGHKPDPPCVAEEPKLSEFMVEQSKVVGKVGELMQHTNEILLMEKCKESSQPTTYDDSLMSQSVSARSEDASSNCSANIEDIEGEKCTAPPLIEEARFPEVQGHKPDPPCVAEEPKLSEFMAEQSKVLVKVGELMQHSNEILLMEKCKESSQPTTYDDSLMSQSVSARSEDASSNCSANIEDIEGEKCTAPPLTEEACVSEVQGHKPDSPCVAEEPKLSEFMAKQSKVLVKVGELMQHTNEILLMEKYKESSQPTTYDDSHMSQSVSARSEDASSNCSANIEEIEGEKCTAPPLIEEARFPEVQGHKPDPPCVAEELKLSEFMVEQSKVLGKVGELMQHTNEILLMEKCKESSQPTTYDDSLMSQSVSARSEDASSNCSANIEDIEEVNCTAPPLTEEACVPEVQGHKPDSPCVAEEPKLSEFMAKQSKVLVKVGKLMQHTNEILLMEKCKESSQPTTYDDSLMSQSVSARSEDASSNCSANIEDIEGENCTAPPLTEEACVPEVQGHKPDPPCVAKEPKLREFMAEPSKVLGNVCQLMQHTNEILLMEKCKGSSQPTTYDDSLISQSVSARSEDASSNCSANIVDIEEVNCTAPPLTEEACVPEVQGHKPDPPCVAEEPKLSEFMAKQSKVLVKVGELMQHTNEILLMEKCKESSQPTTYDDSLMSQSVSARSEDASSNCSANIEEIEGEKCTAPPLIEEARFPEVQGHKPDPPCLAEEPKLSEFMVEQSKVLGKVSELMQHTNEILLMEKCKECSQPTTYDDSLISQSVSARSEYASSNCSANIEDIEEENCTAPPLTEEACVPEVEGHKPDSPCVAEEPKLSEFMAKQSKVLVKVGELMQHTNEILLMEKCKECSQPTTYDDSLMSQSVSARSEDASSNCSANIEDIEEKNCTAPPLTEEACVPEVQGHKPDSPCVAEEPKLSEFMAKQSKVLVKVGELMQHTNEILLMEKCKECSQPTTYDDSLMSQSVSARSEDASLNCSANIEDIEEVICTAPPLIEEARFPEVQGHKPDPPFVAEEPKLSEFMAEQSKVLVKVGELMQHTNEILLMEKCKESSQPTTYDDSLISQSVSARSEDASSNCSANIEDIEGEKCTAPPLMEEARFPEVQGHKPDSPCVAEEPKLSEFMVEQSKVLGKVGELMQHTNEILLMEKYKESSQPTTYDDSHMSQSVSARSEDASSNCSANIVDIEEQNCTSPPLTEEACGLEMPLTTMGELAERGSPSNDDKFFKNIVRVLDELYPNDWRDWVVNDLPDEDLNIEIHEHRLRFAIPTICLAKAFAPDSKPLKLSYNFNKRIRRILIKWPLGRALIYCPLSLKEKIHTTNSKFYYNKFNETIHYLQPNFIPVAQAAKILEAERDKPKISSLRLVRIRGHKPDPPCVAEEPKLSEFMVEQSKVLGKVGELMQHTNEILLMEKCKECSQPTTYDDSLMSQSVSARSEDASSNCSANIEDIEDENCTAPPLTEEACVQEKGIRCEDVTANVPTTFECQYVMESDDDGPSNDVDQTVKTSDPEHSYRIPEEISQETSFRSEIQPTSANETLTSTMKRSNIPTWLDSKNTDTVVTYSGPRKKIVRKLQSWEDVEKTFFTYFVLLDHDYARGPLSGYVINSRIKIAKTRIANIMKYNNLTLSLLNECDSDTDSTSSVEMYKCRFCASEYLDRHDLLNHVEEQHLDIRQELIFNKKVNEDSDSVESIKTYKCDYCDVEYMYETDLLSHVEQHLATQEEEEEETLDIKPEIFQSSQNNAKKSKDNYHFTYSVYAGKDYENTNNGEQQNSESLDSFTGYNFAELRTETEIKKEFCDTVEDVELPMEDQNFDDNLRSNLYDQDSDFSRSHSNININIYGTWTAVGLANEYGPNVDQNNIKMMPEPNAFSKNQDYDWSRINNVIKCNCCKIPFSNQEELLDHTHEIINRKSKLCANVPVMQADSVQFNKPESDCDDDINSSFMDTAKSLDNTQLVFDKPEEERNNNPSIICHSSSSKPKKIKRKCIRCSGRLRNAVKSKRRICFKCHTSLKARSNTMQADSVQFDKPKSGCDDDTNSSFRDTAKSLDNTQLVFDKPEEERANNPSITCHSSTSKPKKIKRKCIRCSGRLRNAVGDKRRICFKCQTSLKARSNTMQADSIQLNKPKSGCDDDTNSSFIDTAKSLDNTQLVFDKPEEERANNPSITCHSSTSKPKKIKRKCIRCSGRLRNAVGDKRRICFKCQTSLKARSNTMQADSIQLNKPQSGCDDDTNSSFIETAKSLDNTQLVFDKPEEERANNPSITCHSSTSKPKKFKRKCIRCSGRLRNAVGDKRRICFKCQTSLKARSNTMQADSMQLNTPDSGCDDDTNLSFMDTAKSLDNTQLVFDKPEEERANNPSISCHSSTSKPKKFKRKCIHCSGRLRNAVGDKRRICFKCQTSLKAWSNRMQADSMQLNKPKSGCDDDTNSSFMDTAKSLDNTQLVFDKPEEERDNNPSITGHSSTSKPKKIKRKCIRCSGRLRNAVGDKRRICFKCQTSLKARSNTMQADSMQLNKPKSGCDDDTNSSFIDTAKSLDNTQLVFDKPEEERDNNPSITGHSSTSKPKKIKRKCIRCSGRLGNAVGDKSRICLLCQTLLKARSNTMQADNMQLNQPKSGCDDDTNSSFIDTAKSLDNTQLVFDKPEEERANNPSITCHSSTSKPKKIKRKCIRCSGRLRNAVGDKRRICFKCQTSLKARSNTMQADSMQLNKPKSDCDDDTNSTMQADSMQLNKPKSGCDDDTNSSFMDTAKSLDNTQLVFDKPEEDTDINPSITCHSLTSKPKKSKRKCIHCSGRLKNARGRRRTCFKCQASLKARLNTWQKIIHHKMQIKISHARTEERKSIPVDNDLLKPLTKEELENLQRSITESQEKNSCIEIDELATADTDLLKPLRIEDEQILVQPRDLTVCKYCLKPLEKTVKSGQNNAFCCKCQSIETSNEVQRQSYEEIRISDLLLCTPDFIAEVSEPNLALTKADSHPFQYGKIQSTRTLKKDKLRMYKVDTKCCVKLERIIIHECRICRSKFINKLDLREHVTRFHLENKIVL